MAIIDWDISLKVGIEAVDEQHKKLIELINRLYEAMSAGRGDQVIGDVLTELLQYTEYHFKTEEDLFAKYGYAESKEHIQEHLMLAQKVRDLKNNFESKKVPISIDLMIFLKDWLINHIMKVDKKYAPFLYSKGVR